MPMSEFFDVTLGLKQRESLPPLLFILFVNDITVTEMTEKDLGLLFMHMIYFADHNVLFTTYPIDIPPKNNKCISFNIL